MQPNLSTGNITEGARGREPTMDRPAGGGCRTLPAGWREILPPNEAWGHPSDCGSESGSTRAAPRPGAGRRQVGANHSALPDEAGTQTDYRQSFGTLPELLPRTGSTWPTVIIDMEGPMGPPTHPSGQKSTSGTRSGVFDDFGPRGPSGSTRCSSDVSVYQDCTNVGGGLEWDDVSLRTAGRPWVESDRAGARVPPPNRRHDSYQGPEPPPEFRDIRYLERPMDLRYAGHEHADHPPERDDQTQVKMRQSGPPAVTRRQAHRPAPSQPESRYIEDGPRWEHANSIANHRDEALAQDAGTCHGRVSQAGRHFNNPEGQARAAAGEQPQCEVDYRCEFDQDPRQRAHPYMDGARIQESPLERELAAGRIVDRRRARQLAQPTAERTRPGFSQRPPAARTDDEAGLRGQPCPEVPEDLPEPDLRPRSVVFSDVVCSWPEDAPEPRLSPWLDPLAQPQPTNVSVHPTENARRQAPGARRALVPHGPLQSSTQVHASRKADPMSPRSAGVSGFAESWLGEPWPTAPAMQPVSREFRYQPPARLGSADGLTQAHMAEVGQRINTRNTRLAHTSPSYITEHRYGQPSDALRPPVEALRLSPVYQHRPVTHAGYLPDGAWNQPMMVPKPTRRRLSPPPLQVKDEPRVSLRPIEKMPRESHRRSAQQPERYPARDRVNYDARDYVELRHRSDVCPPAERRGAFYQPSGGELHRSFPHEAGHRLSAIGATDPRGRGEREGVVSTKPDRKDQRNHHPRRQQLAERRGPGDSPGSSDPSSGDDDKNPPNRRSGAPSSRRGGRNKNRRFDSSPDPSNGSDSDGSKSSDSDDSRTRSSRKSRPPRNTHKKTYLKLKDFDGRSCIEAYLARFEVVSRHNGWSEADRLENLQCALEGNAAQVLWDQGSQGIKSCRRLIKHLKQRFGSEGQQCVYRTQLRSRTRPKGEPLSVTVDEVRRLMALAYPGPMTGDKQTIAIDALLNMLGDGELVLKIREREPETLEEAFKVAMKLEAFQLAGAGSKETGHKPAYARQVQSEETVCEPTADLKTLMKEYNRLQSEKLDRLFDKIRQSQNPAPSNNLFPTGQDGNLRQRSFGRGGNGRRRAPPREPREGDKCFNCGQGGHYANRCPQPRAETASAEETASYPIPIFASPPVPAPQSQRNQGIAGGAPSTPSA